MHDAAGGYIGFTIRPDKDHWITFSTGRSSRGSVWKGKADLEVDMQGLHLGTHTGKCSKVVFEFPFNLVVFFYILKFQLL